MKEYVAGFMKDLNGNIALVRKNKPKWQAGRLNGIGGGIEPGEPPMGAMRREWLEETGDWHGDWTRFAEVRFADVAIHFFKAKVAELPAFPPVNDIGERIEVHPYELAVRYPDMIQNLKWLLPLAFEDLDGLSVTSIHAANDNGPVNAGVSA